VSATRIAGIEVPSDDPLFIAIVGLHVLVALVCVVAGIFAMLSAKGPGRHPIAGSIYYWSLAAVFASATVLAVMRWAEDYPLFILGTLSFVAAFVGRRAHRRRGRNWMTSHVIGMGLSYIFLLTAFYVDNGKNLPLWKNFSPIVFWILPGAVGVPLIIRALRRHGLVR
jgi:hypothetical protein